MHCPQLNILNIEKNGFAHLQNFAKIIINSNNLLLQFSTPSFILACNDIIKIFNEPRKKGNKKLNQLTVDQRDGQFKLKYY